MFVKDRLKVQRDDLSLRTSQHDQSNKTFHPNEIVLSPLLAASLMESTGSSVGGWGVGDMAHVDYWRLEYRYTVCLVKPLQWRRS